VALSACALDALKRLGVEVVMGYPVTECTGDGVVFGDQTLAARVILWAAGVQASPAASWLGALADRVNRAKVESDLSVPACVEVAVTGGRDSAPARSAIHLLNHFSNHTEGE
jgi:NADH dehydrogenase